MESTIPAVGISGRSGQQAPEGVKDALTSLKMDEFLSLMIAELQNQDPLSPKENTEILAQISQMSQIDAAEQARNASQRQADTTNRLADTLDTLLFGQRLPSASGLIGNNVSIQLDELLPESVIDMVGHGTADTTTIARVQGALLSEGISVELPDGRITKSDVESAVVVALGKKGVSIERVVSQEEIGKNSDGTAITRDVFSHFALAGPVDRVSISGGVPKIHVGGKSVDMSDVREILAD